MTKALTEYNLKSTPRILRLGKRTQNSGWIWDNSFLMTNWSISTLGSFGYLGGDIDIGKVCLVFQSNNLAESQKNASSVEAIAISNLKLSITD